MRRTPRTHALTAAAAIVSVLLAAGRSPAEPEILTFGEGTETFYVVDHDDRISIYAEGVQVRTILENLAEIGGPTFSSRDPLSRPVTVTMHRVPLETVLRRILDGFSFSYHYKGGRLDHVNVLQLVEGRHYKLPPALESRSQWERIELAGE